MNGIVGLLVLSLLGALTAALPAMAQSSGTLVDRLQNPSAAIRRAAAHKLGHDCVRPSPQVVPALVKALDDPAWEVRAAAAESLGAFGQAGTKAVPDLIAHAKDEHGDVRDAIALSLGRLNVRSDVVFETLTGLSRDNEAEVRRDAAVAQAMLGKTDDSTMPNVMDALRGGDPRSVDAAEAFCIRMGVESPDKVVPFLVAGLQEYREPLGSRVLKIMTILGTRAEIGVQGVTAAYGKLGPKQRLAALAVIVKADREGQHVVHTLEAALKQPNAAERREALILAMRYRPGWEKLVGPTIEAMKDKDPVNRYLALRSVRQFANETDALLPAIIVLMNDSNPRIRKTAVEMMGHVGKPRTDVLNALEGAAEGDDLLLKITAIKALGNIGHTDPRAVIPILERAGKKDGDERTRKMSEAMVKKLDKQSRPQPSAKEVSGGESRRNPSPKK